MTREDFLKELKKQMQILNAKIQGEMADFVANEISDRLALYLGLKESEMFDARMARIAAKIGARVFSETEKIRENLAPEMAISSISDNGQSISYHNSAKNYLSSAKDSEIFAGFAEILAPYRRINVVS